METVFEVSDDEPCPPNKTMFQGFEWYIPADQQHWTRLAKQLPTLAALGVTSTWIPPAAKAMTPESTGYDVYDLYDLGEFPQKGTTATKWGTKAELETLIHEARRNGIDVLFDTVLNHKLGADGREVVTACRVDPKDRKKAVAKTQAIEVWTQFNFSGRGDQYSSFKWNKEHFTGCDWDQRTGSKGIWKFEGKSWAKDVDDELGNYDYLIGADIDHSHPDVRGELFQWGGWLGSQLKLGGLRLDAVKHYSSSFLRDWVKHLDRTVGKDWFIVGEYWRADVKVLSAYIEFMEHRLNLFDVPLIMNFAKVSRGAEPDVRKVLRGSLAASKPDNAVTFVRNHDTQTGQSIETPIEHFFVPIAYALILLRANFGLPCVFWGDIYGTLGPHHPQPPPHGGLLIPRLMLARKLWAYGTEIAYFSDSKTCVGFTRFGHPFHSQGAGLAVIGNTGWRCSSKRMRVGAHHAGEAWADVLSQAWGEVVVDESGYGVFPVPARGVAVWASKDAPGRDVVDTIGL